MYANIDIYKNHVTLVTMKSKRYTLSLPPELHEELSAMAEKKSVSSRDIVVKCLKLGLLALKLEDDENNDLILKERDQDGNVSETKLLIF